MSAIKKTASEAKAQSESAMAEVSTKETIETHQADVDALKSAIAKKADATEIPTVPTTLPNPSALTISENGTQAASYDGTEAVTVDITPAGIGAAATSHTHAMAEITGLQDAIDKASSSGSGATIIYDGEELDFGGLLGRGPVMKVNTTSPAKMISRGGRIPAPMQSLKN